MPRGVNNAKTRNAINVVVPQRTQKVAWKRKLLIIIKNRPEVAARLARLLRGSDQWVGKSADPTRAQAASLRNVSESDPAANLPLVSEPLEAFRCPPKR
jgi:hypothetical protein